jgi:RNA polymerase primary sigma factor
MASAGVEDMTTHWLAQAGRIPMLTAAEEVHLGGLIRAWQDWEPTPADAPPAVKRRGLRARDRMVAANLRLVAHVTTKARRGLGVPVADADLPDLLQAGAVGLQRGAERFDPTRGYKFSTFAYWWIRQGLSRHIDSHGRTIRIPSTHTGTITRAGRVASALAATLGRTPTRPELAQELGVRVDELERLLLMSVGCYSLDAPLPGGRDDAAILVDMLAADDQSPADPAHDQLLELMAQLDKRAQRLLRGRHGLGEPIATPTELARREGISVHRVRNLLRAAEITLRRLSGVDRIEVASADPGPIPDGAELEQLRLPWLPAQ